MSGRKYKRDQDNIRKINGNLKELLEEGEKASLHDAKRNDIVSRGSLGTYGDILVSLNIDSGSFGYAGHAAIVSMAESYTVESYAQSFSPINIDGVRL